MDPSRENPAEQAAPQGSGGNPRPFEEQSADRSDLFQQVRVGLGICDLACRFVFVNECLAALNGLPVAAHLGRTPGDILPADQACVLMERLQTVMRTGQRIEARESHTLAASRPNQQRVLDVSYDPQRCADGSVQGVVLTVIDASHHQAVEDRLRLSEKRYRDLVEASDDLIWSLDAAGRFNFVNRKAARLIYGYEPEEMIGRAFKDFLAPEYVEQAFRTAQPIRKGHSVDRYETVHVRKDSSRVHLSFNAIPITDEQGRIIGSTGTATDITQWKLAEAALQESQQRFQTFMNRIPLAGFIKDADGRMIYVNQAYIDKYGSAAHRFVGKFDHELWPAEVAHQLREADRQALAGRQPVEVRECVPMPDGQMREWWVIKFPFHDAQGRLLLGGIALDLTERRQLEAALSRSEERYRQLWQRNLAGVFRATLDGRVLDCNDSFARLFGFASRDEMLDRSIKDFYFDPNVRDAFLAQLREQNVLNNYEMRMRRADASPIWVLENVSLLSEDTAEVLEGTVIDISERKRAEEALRASEANYRALINALDQGIFLKDRELRYRTVNALFCQAVHRSEAELHGRTIEEVFPKNALTERSRALELRVLKEGRSIESEEELKIAGRARVVRVARTPVRDAAGAVVGVLGICWDVTEQRSLESQLRHVQKMEAIGQLAGGIAHDFNNLLTIMLGNLSYIRAGNAELPAALEFVSNAEKAGLRAAELTQTLLSLSRRASLATVPLNLNVTIDEVVRLTRSSLPANIELEVQGTPNLWLVQADPGQINQMLTNLVFNARDAMAEGGRLVLQTGHFIPDADYLDSHVEARPGEFVCLRVSDSGHGVAAELRQRIFEPFFTTKDKDKGTGLGLAIVFSIVKQHHGWIVCNNRPERGTIFEVFLPRAIAAAAAPPQQPKPPAAAASETILLVDDEGMIRQLAYTILSRAGYVVLQAENGEEALKIVRANRDRIALVILDSVMPRLSGQETLRNLVQIAPDIRVLFSSGYSTEQLALNEFPQVCGLLSKPYRANELIQKVADMLAEANFNRTSPP